MAVYEINYMKKRFKKQLRLYYVKIHYQKYKSECKNTNGAGTITHEWQYKGYESKQGDRNIVGVLHSQKSENNELKQQTGVDLSVNFEEINKVCKLSEALTDTKIISRVKRQTDDVKISEALSATLIGRNTEQKLKSMTSTKIKYDI